MSCVIGCERVHRQRSLRTCNGLDLYARLGCTVYQPTCFVERPAQSAVRMASEKSLRSKRSSDHATNENCNRLMAKDHPSLKGTDADKRALTRTLLVASCPSPAH